MSAIVAMSPLAREVGFSLASFNIGVLNPWYIVTRFDMGASLTVRAATMGFELTDSELNTLLSQVAEGYGDFQSYVYLTNVVPTTFAMRVGASEARAEINSLGRGLEAVRFEHVMRRAYSGNGGLSGVSLQDLWGAAQVGEQQVRNSSAD